MGFLGSIGVLIVGVGRLIDRVFALLVLGNQRVGQHQLGLMNDLQRQFDLGALDLELYGFAIDAQQLALESFPIFDRFGGFDLGLVAGVTLEILGPGQRPVDTGG